MPNLKTNCISAVFVAVTTLLVSVTAQAATTDWMKPSDASRFAKSLFGGKGTLTGIQCKDSGKAGKVNDMALVKVTYQTNPSKLEWSWGIGNQSWFKKTSSQRAAEGYKRVSYSSFSRKGSGVIVQCAIWHK